MPFFTSGGTTDTITYTFLHADEIDLQPFYDICGRYLLNFRFPNSSLLNPPDESSEWILEFGLVGKAHATLTRGVNAHAITRFLCFQFGGVLGHPHLQGAHCSIS
jgi:hypothetical protein